MFFDLFDLSPRKLQNPVNLRAKEEEKKRKGKKKKKKTNFEAILRRQSCLDYLTVECLGQNQRDMEL